MDEVVIQNESSSPDADEQPNEFQRLRERLEEIADAVDNEDISLDDALDLYEEAVTLGLQATDLLDVGITAQEEAQARILGEDAEAQIAAALAGQENEAAENEQQTDTNTAPEDGTYAD